MISAVMNTPSSASFPNLTLVNAIDAVIESICRHPKNPDNFVSGHQHHRFLLKLFYDLQTELVRVCLSLAYC